jgi:FtsP/CotA-like multicopper oxidase with cupredoxin domain
VCGSAAPATRTQIFASLDPGERAISPPMLSRRHLLLGSGYALAAAAVRANAGDIVVLNAGKEGFNSVVPGPVIQARRGEEVQVRLVNGLDEPTALRWHGVRAANAIDGSGTLVAPGASFDYRFSVSDAGTFWYHAASRIQQETGLYGGLIIAEPAPPPVDQDHVLVYGERKTRDAARCTLNGVTALDIAVRTNERLRLRFINASATQVMDARIEKHHVMVMALDGEPAEPFASRDGSLMLGPGNRADVFVDATLAPGSVAPVTFAATDGQPPAMRLIYGDTSARSAVLGEPAPFPANPLPERMNFSRALRVTLPLDAGQLARLTRPLAPLFLAERGRTVVIALESRDGAAHVVHVHGHHFRLLDRLDDGWKPYWLDTVAVPPRQTLRIAFVADNPGRWLIEYLAIDSGAAAESWFEVR